VADHLPPGPPAAAPEGWPPLTPVVAPPPGRLGRVAVALAALAVLAYLVAGVLFLVPVETPGVQECGAPGAYLLDGRLDRIPDEEGRILDADDQVVTLDPDVAAEARSTPCQERVARRAVPAAALVLAATGVGALAFALELLVVRPHQRRLVRAGAAHPAPPAWGDPPAGSGG